MTEIGKGGNSNTRRLINQSTDYMVAKNAYEWSVDTYIPTKEDWDNNLVINGNEVSIYTDTSKSNTGTGIGIYSEVLNIQKSYRLEDVCCTTQAEIYAIGEATRLIRENDRQNRKVIIYSDSQAALRCIASKVVRSKVVMSCQEALSWIREGKVDLR